MISQESSYARPSGVEVQRNSSTLALSASGDRPVRWHARVKAHSLYLRLALRALGDVQYAGYYYDRSDWSEFQLDPVVSVHPDRISIEVFSRGGVCAVALAGSELFEPQGEVVYGTTNIDFTQALGNALNGWRSSRETSLTIATPASGSPLAFSRRAKLPTGWVRGLLRVQEAMALPGTRISVRPIDLLKTIRYLRTRKGNFSPQALRWEFDPDEPPRMVLEPWEEVIACPNSHHAYAERHVIRTWGRQRLALLESLLPYADVVDVYLKGRALPSFYAVKLPGVTFILALSGWGKQGWSSPDTGFDLQTRRDGRDRPLVEDALAYFRDSLTANIDELAAALGCDWETARRLATRLGGQGRLMFDLERRTYRLRELFAAPLTEDMLVETNLQQQRGLEHVTRRRVRLEESGLREMRKRKRLRTPDGWIEREVVFQDWRMTGAVEHVPVEVVLNDEGRLIFGKCGCAFFRDNILQKGPCEHMIALLEVGAESRNISSVNEMPMAPGGER